MGLLEEGRYSWWQRTLETAFLQEAPGPLVFFIDNTELSRIAPELTDASVDLASAVQEVTTAAPGAFFSRVDAARRRWALGDRSEPPPVLPVLALSVLAAAQMRSDVNALSTNFYLRFAEALLPGGTNREVRALQDQVSGDDFLDVVTMWRTLHDWIEAQDGRIGCSTIRTHARLNRIGYPRSQALLTRTDRADLTRFFRAMDLGSSGMPDEATLLRGLDIWTTTRQNRLGDAFMDALSDESTRGLIGSVVSALAAAWNGETIARDGRRRIPIRLGLDLDDWISYWLFSAEEGQPQVITLEGAADGGLPVRLTQRPPSRYFKADNAPPVLPETIRGGVRLHGAEFTAEFPRTDVIILSGDTHTGAWSSVSGITPYETHIIAVAPSEHEALRKVLACAATPGWQALNQGRNALLPGFFIFEDVRFTDEHALQAALRDHPQLRSLGMAPTLVPRARFVRGLPLARELAQGHYLEGGEPDLLMPTSETGELVPMVLGGKADRVPAMGFPFPLRCFPQPLGTTDVVADGQHLTFTLLEESPEAAPPQGEASLGWTDSGELTTASAQTRVKGSVVSGSPDRPFVACRRDRDETWLLLTGGAAVECRNPGQPTFATGAGLSFVPAFFEVTVPEEAQWLAQRVGSTWTLTRLAPGAPQVVRAGFDVLGTWARNRGDAATSVFWEAQIALSDA